MPPSSPPTYSFSGVSRMETAAEINSKANGPDSLAPLQRTFSDSGTPASEWLQNSWMESSFRLCRTFFPHRILGNLR